MILTTSCFHLKLFSLLSVITPCLPQRAIMQVQLPCSPAYVTSVIGVPVWCLTDSTSWGWLPRSKLPLLGWEKKSVAPFEDFGLITDQEKQKSCVVFSSFSRSVFFSFSFHDLFFYNSFYSWTFSMEQLSPLDKHTLNKAWGMPSLVHV